MRIGIDITPILPPRTGIGHYTLSLLDEMTKMAPVDEFVLFVNSTRRDPPELPLFERPNVTLKRFILPGPWLHTLWRKFGRPHIDFFIGSVDVFHSPWGIALPQKHGKSIATIHDLYCLDHQEDCDRWGGQLIAETMTKTIETTDAIIVDSPQVMRDIAGRFPEATDKIRVIPLGVNHDQFRQRGDEIIDAFIKEHMLPSNYILTVTSMDPRKNLKRLIAGYAHMVKEVGTPPRLVIVGVEDRKSSALNQEISIQGVSNNVVFKGYVPDEHLPMIYNGAQALIMPSLHEGFGLPVLEAMASGTPVAAADLPCFREHFGDACCYFNPKDAEDIAATLKTLVTSERMREEMKRIGRQKSMEFSWEKTAEATLDLYAEISGMKIKKVKQRQRV